MDKKITSIDQPLLDRMSFDETLNAWRTTIVGGNNIQIQADTSNLGEQLKESFKDLLKPVEHKEIQTIQVPQIIKEIVIEKIEVPVFIKEPIIVEKQIIVKEIEFKEIEKTVITTEYKTVEIPVIVNKEIKVLPIWAIITMVVELLGLVLLIAKK